MTKEKQKKIHQAAMELLEDRAFFSRYGEGSLSGRILYLFEFSGGKDAAYLTRL